MLRQKPTLDSEVACHFAAETEQDRIYRTSLDNGLLHSHQTARESHLSIDRWNSHVHYDVPENVGLPRQVFLSNRLLRGLYISLNRLRWCFLPDACHSSSICATETPRLPESFLSNLNQLPCSKILRRW